MDAVLPPDEFRLNDAADFLPTGQGEEDLNVLWGGNNKLAGAAETDDPNTYLADMWEDATSGRALAFYGIPKVRFVFVNLCYLACEWWPFTYGLSRRRLVLCAHTCIFLASACAPCASLILLLRSPIPPPCVTCRHGAPHLFCHIPRC